jgi:hypothetical protein
MRMPNLKVMRNVWTSAVCYTPDVRRLSLRLLIPLLLLPWLTGCFLASGLTETSDRTSDGGNVYVSLVSAEGTETRELQTNFVSHPLDVTVFARTERGQLRIEILDPQDSVVIALDAQPAEQYRRAIVPTDEEGILRYRIRAVGAQRSVFQILYQPADA